MRAEEPPEDSAQTDIPGESLDPESAPALPAASLASHALAALTSVREAARTVRPSAKIGTVADIWRLAWPVMLSQFLVNAVSIVDIAMVGRLGADSVAAVGYAAQFFFLAQSALISVGFACVALVAQSLGAGDRESARQATAASFCVSVLTALALTVPILAAPRTWLNLLSAEPHVIERTLPYLRLLLCSASLLGLSMVFDASLRADKNTTTPMLIALAVTLVKVALNILLIFGVAGFPRLELVGAGIATVVSQVVGVACYIFVARSRPASTIAVRRADLRPACTRVADVRRIALPGVLERVVLNFALLSYFAILGAYGTVAVAAYTVGVRVLSFSWIPGTGYAAAAATLVGQALGAGSPKRAERVGWSAAGLAVATAIPLGAACALGRFELAALFIDDAETIQTLGPFMLCVALAQPMLQLHFTLGGAHRGAGDTWTPMLAATLGNWVFRVPLAVLAGVVLHTELVWIWAALIVDHAARAVWLLWSFRRGGWKQRAARITSRQHPGSSAAR